MTRQPAVRFYGPHRIAVWNLCAWIAGGHRTALGTVVEVGGEDQEGMRFRLGAGQTAVRDMPYGWTIHNNRGK